MPDGFEPLERAIDGVGTAIFGAAWCEGIVKAQETQEQIEALRICTAYRTEGDPEALGVELSDVQIEQAISNLSKRHLDLDSTNRKRRAVVIDRVRHPGRNRGGVRPAVQAGDAHRHQRVVPRH